MPKQTLSMMFAERLREVVRRGEITCSVRIWMRPHVRLGNRYRISRYRRSIAAFPPTVPAGLPFNVAQLYMRMAEGIREGRSVNPDFDVAVKRHQLLDVIQKASDTGIRQNL